MKNKIISSLEDLAKYEATKREQGFQFKIAMYRKAVRAFKASNIEPSSYEIATNILTKTFKNPTKILLKIKELFDTGKIAAVNKASSDPFTKAIILLSSVPQIGPVKAKVLVEKHNITSILQLKKALDLLNDKQKIGLKYYDELIDPKTLDAVRIPRKEIRRFEKTASEFLSDNLTMLICGSYRRKATSSGDIDALFTGNKSEFKQFVTNMSANGYLKDAFSNGQSKWMGMGLIDKLHRRIDLMYIDRSEYYFAVLYFTGSMEFNTALRGYCRKLGYTLNEHGLKTIDDSKIVQHNFDSEQSIFRFLKIPYIEPEDRKAGKFSLPNIFSSIKLNRNIPRDIIHCLKGKGLDGFTISEIRDIAKSRGMNSSGTKKQICQNLFKTNINRSKIFDVSKGVLLANTYKNKTDPTTMIASEKFDGIRALWDGKNLKSRTNKIIFAPQWFKNTLPHNHALDGELYLRRGAFEATTSIVSKKVAVNEEWKRIKYMLFDVPSNKSIFVKRLEILKDIIEKQCKTHKNCPLVLVNHLVIRNRNHMTSMFKDIISKGGEGIMLRDSQSLYQQKRTKDLLKVKQTENAEGIIINMVEGKGKDIGKMGALKMQHKNTGIEFKIGTGFTSNMRKEFWSKKNDLIGNIVTFGYKGLTAKGVPRHPAFMRIYKNM
jgi:DNA ligase-1